MLIKITEKCSMGCSHCMNNAMPTGKHMSFDTFKDVIKFEQKYGTPFCIISGGEPTEHPNFEHFLLYALNTLPDKIITVTTNGVWLQSHYDFVYDILKGWGKEKVLFQVTTIPEYYPEAIDTTLPVFSLPNVVVCKELESIYPQGRALENNLPYQSKASKCTNIRLMAHQIGYKGLANMLAMMAVKGFFCTPHINIEGFIKLGESDLCPICSDIYKSEKEIVDDILNFKCQKCNFINKDLPVQVKILLGEK